MTPLTPSDIALIAAILGPILSFIAIFIANWFTARHERARWKQEQEFENQKWQRIQDEERQKDIQARLFEVYSNCIQALSAIVSVPMFNLSQSLSKEAVYNEAHTYFSTVAIRRREAERWLFLLVMYGILESTTEESKRFETDLQNFLSSPHPVIVFRMESKEVIEQADKANAIAEKTLLLRKSLTDLAKRDQRLRITMKY